MYLFSNLIAKNLRENLRTTPGRRPPDARTTLDGSSGHLNLQSKGKKETLR